MGHDELLRASEFFAETSDAVLATITSQGEVRNLQRGDVLFKEGEKPESMFIVLSGRVAIAIGNRPMDSRESVLALMERGDLFGELGLLDGGERSAMARA
ncbi:MAG: cyclic nucleotide-binding domain-containing protein, partial [Actinomycetota bacterium]